jgi:PEP-CTERM motif
MAWIANYLKYLRMIFSLTKLKWHGLCTPFYGHSRLDRSGGAFFTGNQDMNFRSMIGAAVLAIVAASGAQAANLVTNGDFEQWNYQGGTRSGSFSAGNTAAGQLVDWTATGLNVLFVPGDTRADVNPRATNFRLWGMEAGDGVANGFTRSSQGGNFVAADADPRLRGPISQLVTGFVVGRTYEVSFEWGAGQQVGFRGPTTEQWNVSLLNGANTSIGGYSTTLLTNPDQGFQSWRTDTFRFIATEASHTLRFLANGGPSGMPPFALLDDVSIQSVGVVPEPSSWVMLIAGFGLVGAAARRRRVTTAVAA